MAMQPRKIRIRTLKSVCVFVCVWFREKRKRNDKEERENVTLVPVTKNHAHVLILKLVPVFFLFTLLCTFIRNGCYRTCLCRFLYN